MPVSLPAVGVCVAGGILVFSGARGSTMQNTLTAVLKGNLPTSDDQPVSLSGLLSPIMGIFGIGGSSSTDSTDSSGQTVSSGAANATAAANQATAKKVMQQLGPPYSSWQTGQNWTDLVELWNKESGWSATIKNPTSGAYGIAQALPESKYPPAGQESGGSNPGAQISWGLEYIRSRYGSPVMAWAHEQANNWY